MAPKAPPATGLDLIILKSGLAVPADPDTPANASILRWDGSLLKMRNSSGSFVEVLSADSGFSKMIRRPILGQPEVGALDKVPIVREGSGDPDITLVYFHLYAQFVPPGSTTTTIRFANNASMTSAVSVSLTTGVAEGSQTGSVAFDQGSGNGFLYIDCSAKGGHSWIGVACGID